MVSDEDIPMAKVLHQVCSLINKQPLDTQRGTWEIVKIQITRNYLISFEIQFLTNICYLVSDEDIPMAKVYHQLINLTNKPPSLRTNEELDELVPWLRKKSSSLFQTLEDRKYDAFTRKVYQNRSWCMQFGTIKVKAFYFRFYFHVLDYCKWLRMRND